MGNVDALFKFRRYDIDVMRALKSSPPKLRAVLTCAGVHGSVR